MSIVNLTLASLSFADDANNLYTGTDKLGLFIGGSKTTITYTATLSNDVDQVYFAPEMFTPSLYRQALTNYDSATHTPYNGFFAAISGDGVYSMAATGSGNYYETWGDLEAVSVTKSGTTFTFSITFRPNADAIGAGSLFSAFNRYSKASRLDPQAYGLVPYAPSAYNQNGVQHYLKAWYLAADTGSGDTWEGEHNLAVFGAVDNEFVTPRMEAYNSVTTFPIATLTNAVTTDIPASNVVQFKGSISILNMPVGSSVVGDIEGQVLMQLFVYDNAVGLPYIVLDGSSQLLEGTQLTANRLVESATTSTAKAVTSGTLDWELSISCDATLSDLLGKNAFLLFQTSVVDNTEGEIYANVTYFYPIRFTNASTLQEAVETELATNNGAAINARTYSNAKLNATYYTLTGTDDLSKYINAESDATYLERFVTWLRIDTSALDALNTFGVSTADWRNGLKRVTVRRATEYSNTNGAAIATTEWGFVPRFVGATVTPDLFGDLDRVQFAYDGDKIYVSKQWQPYPLNSSTNLVEWTGIGSVNGSDTTLKQWGQLIPVLGLTYADIESETINAYFDFELEGFGDLLQVNFYTEIITYVTPATTEPTIKTINRDSTVTTYADDDFFLQVGVFDSDFADVESVAYDYPNASVFDGTNMAAAAIVSGREEIYTQDSASVGLAAATFAADDVRFIDEANTGIEYDASNNRLKVQSDIVNLDTVYQKHLIVK